MSGTFARLRNPEAVPVASLRELTFELFRGEILEQVGSGLRIGTLFGLPDERRGEVALVVVLADDADDKYQRQEHYNCS